MGIEAISRGSGKICFIEKDFNTHKILDSNLKLLESDRYDLINQDSLKYLEKEQLQPFDFVFLDPPFNQELIPLTLSLISKQNLVDLNSKIYVESEFEIDLELLNSNIKYNCTIEKQKKSALPPLFYGFYGPTISELTDLGACHWPIFMENLVQTRNFSI